MMLNFTGLVKAPYIDHPPIYVATYSDGFNLRRKEIHAPTRLAAYAIATGRPPLGCTLTQLRKKKSPAAPKLPSLAERVDVSLARALFGIYANTDAAARFAAAELRSMAAEAA